MLKVAQKSERDERVCLNIVKKDQLCATALMKKNINFEGSTQNATSHTFLRF